MDRKLVPHHAHWGAFNAVVEGGKAVGAVPFAPVRMAQNSVEEPSR